MAKWNRVLSKMDTEYRVHLPDRKFYRRQGIYSGHHFDPHGNLMHKDAWEAKREEWLPTSDDRAYVKGLMKPVHDPGKMANWIAAPKRGINRQDIAFEYVRTDS